MVAVRRQEQMHFLIWYTDEQDGLVTGDDGAALLSFASDSDARAHAAAAGFTVSPDESAYFDLDELEAWTAAPNPHRLKPETLLNAWNLLAGVARSVGNDIAAAALRERPLPPLTDHSDRLTREACAAIAPALRHGLACFDRAITPPAPARR